MSKPQVINGVEYRTIAEACKAYGIVYETVCRRLRRGMPAEQAFTYPNLASACSVDYLGREYSSLRQMAKAYGISHTTLAYRLDKGVPLKKALDKNYSSHKCHDHLGQVFPSAFARAKHWGKDPFVVWVRLKRGWSVKDALTVPTKKRKR